MYLRDKIALITGASRGIGRAMALRFAGEGAHLVLCARNGEALQDVAQAVKDRGRQIVAEAADIGIDADVQRLVGTALKAFGRIDVLVNNASILGPRAELLHYPHEIWEDVLRVNLTGTFLITQAVARLMVERGQGSIINVSSGAGVEGKPRWGAYSVSKFGVEALTQIWSKELRPYNVRVNTVNPGSTATQMRREAYPEEDQSKLPRPEEVLGVFVFLGSDESRGITGQRFDAPEFRWPR
jgi:NAD(P)-dependent dehydrogenase (short-subunit alcohol dehydrogenase family)